MQLEIFIGPQAPMAPMLPTPLPFHIMVAQAIHSLTRSKEPVTALNHHGIFVSYNTVKRIDVDLAELIITTAGDNRVPIPPAFEIASPLNGAMDNFDRNESTLAGTGSTHNTILVLFQNVPVDLEKPSKESKISERPIQSQTTVRLQSQVKCQQLIRIGAIKEHGEIAISYKVSDSLSDSTIVAPDTVAGLSTSTTESLAPCPITTTAEPTISTVSPTAAAVDALARDHLSTTVNNSTSVTKSIKSDYFLWIINCFLKQATHERNCVPGFTAVRSATISCNFSPTTTVLTPILPHPATTYDSIFTTMVNFQDALKQKGYAYGALWADEGAYCIAKEIQLMKPDQFDNIFLGLGGFHMEKIVLACVGLYLEPSGIFGVLVETECYGTDVIKTVISGSHYSRDCTAHSVLHEVFTSMMLKEFLSKYPDRQVELKAMQVNCESKELLCENWITAKEGVYNILAAFEEYLKERAFQSQSFN